MTERVVVYVTDLTGGMSSGLGLATRLAAEQAATLVVLHVAPLDGRQGEGMLHQAASLLRGDAGRRLRALKPPDPSVPYLHVCQTGDPEEVILDVVAREQARLLVVEERPRAMWRQALGRSLAERLVQRAACPVVVYRPGTVPSAYLGAEPPPPPVFRHPLEVLDLLTSLLEARVFALVTWMDQRREAISQIANACTLRDEVASFVLAGPGRGPLTPEGRSLRRLRLQLDEHQRALGALGALLEIDGVSVVRQGVGAVNDPARAEFDRRLDAEGQAISLPLDADDGRPGGLVILVGARLDLDGIADARLVFTLDARRDFLRILAQPGPTASTETYAFDQSGLMLSNSRFPGDLQRLGLLPPEPGAQAPRRLRVCEPVGESVSPGFTGPWRLTRAAADAVQGHDGSDCQGYADYRGIEVVGAWKWVSRYGFGVTAEMDRASLAFA